MKDGEAILAGQLAIWPTRDDLAAVLQNGGLSVRIGAYSLRLEDCQHFVIQGYGGDLESPLIDATAATVSDLHRDAQRVSNALSAAQIKHRFEIYGPDEVLERYLHFQWPSDVQLGVRVDGK